MTKESSLHKSIKINLSKACTLCKKKILVVLLLVSLLISMESIVCNAHAKDLPSSEFEIKTYKSKKEFKKSKYDTLILKDTPETSLKLKKGCVVVTVRTLCDKKYQKLHKNDWKIRAKNIVKKGTKVLYSKFNIHFTVKKAVSFTSAKSEDAGTLLKEFANKYKAGKKIDMNIGFSGKNPQYVAGIAYMGKMGGGPRMLIFSSTYEAEVETAQHELGHAYDLIHCTEKCVMTAQGFGYLNKFCSAHLKQWKKNRKYYN